MPWIASPFFSGLKVNVLVLLARKLLVEPGRQFSSTGIIKVFSKDTNIAEIKSAGEFFEQGFQLLIVPRSSMSPSKLSSSVLDISLSNLFS